MKEEFPKDDFGVITKNENHKEILRFLNEKGFDIMNLIGGSLDNQFYCVHKGSNTVHYRTNNLTSKTYTLEQLKAIDMNEKKIVKYKVLKTCWGKAGTKWSPNDVIYITNIDSLPYFKEIGLLDNPNYFEPVYEPEKLKEEIISMGNFNLKVTKDGIFHKSENITNYVEDVAIVFKNLYNFGYNDKRHGYDFIVKDIILSKTGCESTETTVSQWLKVWDKYQEFNK